MKLSIYLSRKSWIMLVYCCALSLTALAQTDIDVSYNLIQDKYYALIISPDKNEDWGDLSNVVNEGARLKEILDTRYVFEEVRLIKNPTVSDFFKAFSEIQAKLREQDNLFIYYNGHGDIAKNTSKQKIGFWVMSDSKRKDKSTWVLNRDVKNILNIINCRHILLVVDACFGGSVFMKGPGLPMTNDYLKKSCTAITSAGLENVYDGGEFFRLLETTMRTNQKPLLRESEIFFSIKTGIDVERSKGNSIPAPKMGPLDGRMNGEFIFKLKREEDKVAKKQVPKKVVTPVEEEVVNMEDKTKEAQPVKDMTNPYFSFQNNTIVYEFPPNQELNKGANVTAKLYDTNDLSYEGMYPHDLLLTVEESTADRLICRLDISKIPWYIKKKNSQSLVVRLRIREANKMDVELGKFPIQN